jgi:D,D-heptose 1,7-bisphosphate phosphatase
MSKAAIFWDRDDTLIKDPGYLSDPELVELLPGAAETMRRLGEAGFENVIVTNQSGIARGLLDEATLEEIHGRLRRLLHERGAQVDAIYYCPYLAGPEAVVEAYRRESDLRKPKPGMLVQAAFERQLDLAASWSIGDSVRDAQAGRAAGCRTILVKNPKKPNQPTKRTRDVDFVVDSLAEAAEVVQKHTRAAEDMDGASVSKAVSADQSATDGGGTESLLQEILVFLRTQERRRQERDFSLAQLSGAIVQALAILVFIWGMINYIAGTAGGNVGIKLLSAIFLQLVTLTLFMLSGRK